MDPNKAQSYYDYQTQQEVWAQELRRADDRSHKFKQDLEVLDKQKQSLEVKIKDQEHAIMVREQEIQRLTLLYKGGQTFDGVKQTFDRTSAQETISKHEKHIEFLNGENHKLETEMQEIKELLGICESRDPTDKDRVHLKTLVRSLKQQNDRLKADSKTMERTIGDLKSGKYSVAEASRMVGQDEAGRLKHQLDEADQQMDELRRENQRMK